ncbi:MAG TPA: MOP flippase family protein [Flavobacterium sp.]|nr:MOP flippase family protein [Flavobacterium sp.]
MALRQKVKSGLIWTFADKIVSQVVFLVFGIVLARLVSPSAFGLVGMVTIFSNFALLFLDLGFGAALVQKKDISDVHLSSVFWMNMGIGFSLYGLFFAAAPLLADFYGQPELTLLIRVICLTFILSSASSVQSNMLVKDLKFRKKVVISWVSMAVGYGLAFYLAFHGFGPWALVAMTLSTAAISTVMCWFATPWFPSFVFEWDKIKELSRFGLNFLGDTSVNYWSRNYDNFIVAKVLGSTDLGIYSRAYSLMLLPLRNITTIFARVMFPAFAQRQGDLALLRKYYLEIILHIALITFPLMVALAMVSREFVLVFFGPVWVRMVPVLSILAGLGAVQSVVSLNGLIYNSLGKAHIAFRVSVFSNLVLIAAMTAGVQFGIVGVSWSYLIASLVLFFPIYGTAIRQLELKIWDVVRFLKGIIIATLLMAAALFLLNLFTDLPPLLGLVVKGSGAAIVYGSAVLFLERKLVAETRTRIMKLIPKRK